MDFRLQIIQVTVYADSHRRSSDSEANLPGPRNVYAFRELRIALYYVHMPPPLCTAPGRGPYVRPKLHYLGATSALTSSISHISSLPRPSSFHILHLLPGATSAVSAFSSLSNRGSSDTMSRRTTNNNGNNVLARPAGPTPRTRALSPPASRRTSVYTTIGEGGTVQLHWLFRSNIPRRRGMPMPTDVRKRNFFGIGEIIGVLANVRITIIIIITIILCVIRNGCGVVCTLSDSLFPPSMASSQPSETLRSLTESKKMLEETKAELSEARERAQLTPTHTFSALPGFYDRPAELKAITRALEGEPSFTVLFGASSVGKVRSACLGGCVFAKDTIDCTPSTSLDPTQLPCSALRPSYRWVR